LKLRIRESNDFTFRRFNPNKIRKLREAIQDNTIYIIPRAEFDEWDNSWYPVVAFYGKDIKTNKNTIRVCDLNSGIKETSIDYIKNETDSATKHRDAYNQIDDIVRELSKKYNNYDFEEVWSVDVNDIKQTWR
jgi:hypothetical protein